jgi:hypothetical protein
MAIAKTYTSENCAGIPKGVVVRVHTDRLAADQPAAWENARRISEKIYWDIKMAEYAGRNAQ